LVECGLNVDDPAVKKAAAAVRSGSPSLTHTYTLSLCIMFLDRLNDPDDAPYIESMAVRLLAGQGHFGGWNYHCPEISNLAKERLAQHFKLHSDRLAAGKGAKMPADKKPRNQKELPKEIVQQLVQVNRPGGAWMPSQTDGDNSNTQFATLALWIARRHGLPVD